MYVHVVCVCVCVSCQPGIFLPCFLGVGQLLRKATAGAGVKLSLELGGKSPFIVYDSADLDSAAESVVDALSFNQGQGKFFFWTHFQLSL